MSIKLVKVSRDGDKILINRDSGTFEGSDAGVMIKFFTNDKRKPQFFGLIDEYEIMELQKACKTALKLINEKAQTRRGDTR